MADNSTLARLRDHIAREFSGLNQITRDRIETLWLNAGSWRDADIERLSAQSWAIARASMGEVAKVEAAYQAASIAAQTGTPSKAVVLSKDAIEAVVDKPLARFAQPGAAIHTALARGDSLKSAVELGARQAAAIATRSLVDARMAQVQHSWTAGSVKITKYRRSLGGSACEYCSRVIGSGRKMYSGEPKPIHTSCDCGFEPVALRVSKEDAAADARKKSINDARAKAAEVRKARQADPAAQREYLERVASGFQQDADRLRAAHSDIASLPIEQRRVIRRQIGIADQRAKNAKAALTG